MAAGWRVGYTRYRKFFLNIYRVYNQKPDVKMFLETLLTLGVIAFFGASALRPTILTIIDLTEQIKTKEEVVIKMDTKIQNLSLAQNIYSQELDSILLLDSAVPNAPSPEIAARQFEGLANQNSVGILGMAAGEVVIFGKEEKPKRKREELSSLPGGAKELSFTLSVSGSFQSLNSFLSSMDNTRRPIKTDAASINSSLTDIGNILVLVVSGRLPYIK